jgi:hypothetical protein
VGVWGVALYFLKVLESELQPYQVQRVEAWWFKPGSSPSDAATKKANRLDLRAIIRSR